MTDENAVVQKRRTAAEIEQIVGEFESSGLNRSQFCRRRGLALVTLSRYLKRMGGASTNDAAHCELVAVELRGMNPGAEANCGLAVVLSGGRRIEVGAAFDAPTLQRLVQTLETI
jgi:hypothetical protein